MESGGLREALVRSLLYVGMELGAPDERGFEAVRRFRAAQTKLPHLGLQQFKSLVREQYLMLLVDEEAALSAIPILLKEKGNDRSEALRQLEKILTVRGELTEGGRRRLSRVVELFNSKDADAAKVALVQSKTRSGKALAS